jgi:hypothetical protein
MLLSAPAMLRRRARGRADDHVWLATATLRGFGLIGAALVLTGVVGRVLLGRPAPPHETRLGRGNDEVGEGPAFRPPLDQAGL